MVRFLFLVLLAVRGESPASIETGDAPGSQGATSEHIGQYVSEEQRSESAGPPTRVSQRVGVQEGCSAGRMPAEFHHGLLEASVCWTDTEVRPCGIAGGMQDRASACGTLEGVVVDISGSPVVDTELVLIQGEDRRTATTPSDGRFALSPVRCGAAELTVRKLGFEPIALPVALADTMAPMHVVLRPAPLAEVVTVTARRDRAPALRSRRQPHRSVVSRPHDRGRGCHRRSAS